MTATTRFALALTVVCSITSQGCEEFKATLEKTKNDTVSSLPGVMGPPPPRDPYTVKEFQVFYYCYQRLATT